MPGDNNNAAKLHCLCHGPSSERFMISCDGGCDTWFHGKCVNISELDSQNIDAFYCQACSERTGMTTTRKPKCIECHNYITQRPAGTKYCSDDCGMRVARRRLAALVTDGSSMKLNGTFDQQEPIDCDPQSSESLKQFQERVQLRHSALLEIVQFADTLGAMLSPPICGFDDRYLDYPFDTEPWTSPMDSTDLNTSELVIEHCSELICMNSRTTCKSHKFRHMPLRSTLIPLQNPHTSLSAFVSKLKPTPMPLWAHLQVLISDVELCEIEQRYAKTPQEDLLKKQQEWKNMHSGTIKTNTLADEHVELRFDVPYGSSLTTSIDSAATIKHL